MDIAVLQRAILPLRLDAIGVLLEVLALIFMYALNGVDRTRFVMIASIICQWIFLLPVTYWISITLGYGLVGAWSSWLFFQLLQVFVFCGAWLRLRFRLSD